MRTVNLNEQEERSGMQGMFLDDVRAGQVFKSTSVTVSTEDILAFARAFDPNPFHRAGHVHAFSEHEAVLRPEPLE